MVRPVLFAIAVLTNIKAKLIGEFTLSRFGPTEFKTALTVFGITLAALTVFQTGIAQQTALIAYSGLILLGLIQLPIQLIRAVKEVNRSGVKADTSEWITGQTAGEQLR